MHNHIFRILKRISFSKKFLSYLFLAFTIFLLIFLPNIAYSQEAGAENTAAEKTEFVEKDKSLKSESSDNQNPSNQDQSQHDFMVTFDHEKLFMLSKGIGTKSVEDRGNQITENLTLITKNQNIPVDSLVIRAENNNALIMFKNTVIMTVTEDDANLVNNSVEGLSQEYLQILKENILQYRKERSVEYLRRSFLYAFISTVVLLLLLILLNNYFPKLAQKIHTNIVDSSHGTVRIKQKFTDGILWIVKTSTLAINLGIFYIYVGLIASLFPWTKGIGKSFTENFISGFNLIFNGIANYLPNLFIITFICLISYYLLKFVNPIFTEIEKGQLTIPNFYPEWAKITYKLIEISIICLTAIMVFPYLPGFGSPAFQGVSLFMGILFSLSSSGVVSNAIAGIILIYTRAFQIDDRVEVDNSLGDILEKSVFVTRIKTSENVVITIPNSKLLSSNIINYSAWIRDQNFPVILKTSVTIGYNIPWQLIHRAFIQAALKTEYVVSEPMPFVLHKKLESDAVTYELRVYTNSPNKMSAIYSGLHQNIQDKCNEMGIEILSPHYAAIRDGNHSTIPKIYLPKDYKSPSFSINPFSDLSQIDFQVGSNNNNHKT